MIQDHDSSAAASSASAAPRSSFASGYEAFVSYRHEERSRMVARRLEAALKTYGRSVLTPPRRIFRDEQTLRPGEPLAEGIARGLRESGFLILLATLESAGSRWVADEIRIWCEELGRTDRLVVVHVDGQIAYAEDGKRIDWTRTDALPPALATHLDAMPVLVDMRWAEREEQLDLRNPAFITRVNALAALLEGLTPEEMNGEEVRAHRRNVRLKNGALATITSLALVAAGLAAVSVMQRNEARREARAGELATRALQMQESDTTRAFRLLSRGYAISPGATIRKLIHGWYATRTFYSRELIHPGHRVGDVAWSDDGGLLLVANGPVATLWRTDDWQRVHTFDPGAQAVLSTALLDGDRVAVMGFSGELSTWDARTGDQLDAQGWGGQLEAVAWAPDGTELVAVVGGDAFLCSRAPLVVSRRLDLGGQASGVAAFSPTGSFAVARDDGVVALFAPGSSQPVLLDGHREAVEAMAFSRDGSMLVTGSYDETAIVWDLANDRRVYLQGQFAPISAVAVTGTGDRIATATNDGRVTIWSASAEPLVDIDAHGDAVRGLAFSPDGRWLASSGDTDASVRIWAADSLDAATRTIAADAFEVKDLTFSRDGRSLAVVGADGVRLHPLDPNGPPLPLDTGRAQRVSFDRDGERLLVVSDDAISVWTTGGERESSLEIRAADAAFVDDGGDTFVAALTGNGWTVDALELLDLNGATREQLPLGGGSALAVSPDGSRIAVGTDDGDLHLLDTSLRLLSPPRPAHESKISDVTFSADGTHVATASWDETARVWSVADGRLVAHLGGGHQSYIVSVAFSHDGERLITGGYESPGTAVLWNWREGYVEKVFRGHATRVQAATLSPVEPVAATGDMDGVVKLWDTRSTLDAFLSSNRLQEFAEDALGLSQRDTW